MANGSVTLREAYDVLLLDLDGVVYRGQGAVPEAVEALKAAQGFGVRLGFVTNNAARTPAEVAEHLAAIGVACTHDQVVTSAQVGAELLAQHIPAGSRVLAVGGPGVAVALQQQGFVPVRAGDPGHVLGVLQGYGPDVSWRDLAAAAFAVQAGAFWVATNTDRTIPTAEGIAPGNGTLVAAVTAATGITPPAAGKPEAAMMHRAARRLAARRPLAIGDRLDTDIKGADAAGIDSLLVLTGVNSVADLLGAPPEQRPTYVATDLRGLSRNLPRLNEPTAGEGPDQDAADLVREAWNRAGTGDADQITALLAAAADR